MVLIEKVRGGPYNSEATGYVSIGDRVDVSEGAAAYLCDDREEFDRVDDAHDVEFDEVEDSDAGDEDDDRDLEELSHEDLKDVAEERGVADEIDLRSKQSIIDGLESESED